MTSNGLPVANYVVPQMVDGWAGKGGSAKLKDSTLALTTQLDRKRGRPLGSKSKRLRLDTDDALLLKSSWEEAQELLRPPPLAVPTKITIDGHEFEEYSVLTSQTWKVAPADFDSLLSDLEVLQSILILESLVQFFKDLRIVFGRNFDDCDHHHVKADVYSQEKWDTVSVHSFHQRRALW